MLLINNIECGLGEKYFNYGFQYGENENLCTETTDGVET